MSPQESSPRRRFSVKAESSELTLVRRFVEEEAARAGLQEPRVFDLKVAVSEACANAVEHSGENPGPLEIISLRTHEHLTFQILDTGDFRVPEANVNLRRESRGLGLPLMVALMDEVNISRLQGGGTKVTLSVSLRSNSGAVRAR